MVGADVMSGAVVVAGADVASGAVVVAGADVVSGAVVVVALTTVELVGTVVDVLAKVDVVSVATVVSTPGTIVGKFESGASSLNSTLRHSPGSPPGALPNTLIIESINRTLPASTG